MEFVTLVQNGGPYALAGVIAFLYMAERTERKEWQAKYGELNSNYLERVLNALNAASQATRDGTTAVQALTTMFNTAIFRIRNLPHDEGGQ